MTLDRLAQRQVDLGPAGFFRVEAESPAGNQVRVKAGFLFAGAHRVYDRFTAGDQTSAGFASVSGAGFKRYDLVYIDATGAVQIAGGTEVAVAAPDFQGGPGFTGGPALPDQIIPLAYILVTETGAVTVTATDITNVTGIFYLARDLDGYLVDKGLIGLAPTGASTIVTAMFAGETPGGGSTARGIVTTPPANYVSIVDANGDELIQNVTSARIYGRITEAGGIWTLSYFYINPAGVETAVVAIQTETEGGAPTDLRLIGTPKVFSRNDPARPLFDSTVYRLSDQIVGDIPDATTTVKGKVELATDGEVAANVVVQGNDARLQGPRVRRNSGVATGRRSQINLIEGGGLTIGVVDDPGGDEVDVTLSVTGSFLPSTYRMRANSTTFNTAGNITLAPVDGVAYTPRLALLMARSINEGALENAIGFAIGTTDEVGWVSTGAQDRVQESRILDSTLLGGQAVWDVTQFTSVNVILTKAAGATTWAGRLLLVGDGA